MLIQAYKIVDYVAGRYVIQFFKSMHDVSPTILKMGVWKFEDWRMDKWDRTEIDIRKFIPPPADKKLIITTNKKKKDKGVMDVNLDMDMDIRIDIALENIEKDIRNINNRMHTMQLQIAKLANNINVAKETETKVKVILPEVERKIMDHVLAEIEKNGYIAEGDIIAKGCSNAVIQRTIENKEILQAFGLQRIKANKANKEKLGFNIKGWPFIICEVN